MRKDFGVIILSGGRSERMNYPKAFLKIEGISFLQRLVDTYSKVVSEITIVLNHELDTGKWKTHLSDISDRCRIVLNHHSEKGKFHSLQLGAKNIQSNFCFIQNVDNPFITVPVLETLRENKNLNGITVPTYHMKS